MINITFFAFITTIVKQIYAFAYWPIHELFIGTFASNLFINLSKLF